MKPSPGRERARQAGAQQADRDADLAAGRAGQELAERDDIGIGCLVEPAAARDELVAEIAEMRDRAAEGGQAEPQEDEEDPPRAVGEVMSGMPVTTVIADALYCFCGRKSWLAKGELFGIWITIMPTLAL